ncbi:MAG: thioredoxin domain-containing protein [Candidatus Gracilibacteria bacterium]|nr:thioredoxin domain-containing protein [Candidatus Gracilibacteria bacterium]
MTEENKNTTAPKVEKKKEMKCIVIALLVVSILSNIASAWYFSNSNFEKIMANEYSKYGGKANYELANEAQSIQIASQIDQIKQYIDQNKKATNTETKTTDTTKTEDTTSKTNTEVKKLSAEEITSIKKDAYIEGNKDAKITLVEYTDPECPYCIRQARSGVIEELKKDYGDQVNNILKPFKAVPHKNADAESIAILCAGKVGGVKAYSSYYSYLFKNNSGSNDGEGIKLDQLTPIAKELKIDTKKFQACYDAKDTLSTYQSYTTEGTKLGVEGTPGTVIINNETGEYTLIAGAFPKADFVKAIDKLLGK